MPKICLFLCLLGCVQLSSLQAVGSGDEGNLRVCVVEGRGTYKRAGRFCPILDEEKSGVECVIGADRLDCLRRMGKGTVDFGVFSPEDLVAAQWANLEVLVTNELRNRPRPFERSIVAVVNRRVLPASSTASAAASGVRAVLRNATLCHQGHGGDDSRILSDTLTEYLESLVTERSCNSSLSFAEDRIRALDEFFARACIAGPWLPDPARDAELKSRYPSLCGACSSRRCAKTDPFWGVTGALACLVEGSGDVMWAQLDDVQAFFGLSGAPAYAPAEQFALLCRDGSWQSLVDNTEPCVWLNVPWPVIVAKRKAAEAVRSLALSLNASTAVDSHWHGALASLLDATAPPAAMTPPRAPQDYLATASGFRDAYSRTGCSTPRHVTVCTTSLLEKNKCEWLSEAAVVYGIAPPLQCALRTTKEDCFEAIEKRECDVTMADSDWLVRAQRDYSVSPVLHESTPIIDQTSTVVAYVKESAMLETIDALRGKRASFPRFDGFAWHAVSQYLAKKEAKPCNQVVNQYFSEVCTPGIESQGNYSKALVDRMTRICYKEEGKVLNGELQALRLLVEDKSDVAFLSMGTFHKYSEGKLVHETWAKEVQKIVPLCPEGNAMYCFVSWSTLGQVYAAKNITSMRRQEIINIFEKSDQLFGKKIPFRSPMFSLYGPYNHESDVLFHNNTKSLATAAILFTHPYDKIPMNFERSLTADSCQLTSFVTDHSANLRASVFFMIVTLVVLDLFR